MSKKTTNRLSTFTDEEFTALVAKATSLNQLGLLIRLPKTGDANKQLKMRIETLQLSTAHFVNQRLGSGIYSVPLSSQLVENSNASRNSIKRKLVKAGLLENKCALCSIPAEWNGMPLTLQLDHTNGVSRDNRVENLRLLCPNCHSQTATFGGKNQKAVLAKKQTSSPKGRNSARPHLRKFDPTPDQLKQLVWQFPTTELAKPWGVSDKAVENRCKAFDIKKPPRGYWSKQKAYAKVNTTIPG
jgi:hypothetical protein